MSARKLAIGTLAGVVLSVQTGCGTLLHPERKGQRPGAIDPAILILDGIGLFFFLIPGIIAFVVDASNNTLYLPAGGGAGAGDEAAPNDGWRAITVEGPMDAAAIDAALAREAGVAALSTLPDVRMRIADAREARDFRRSARR